LADLPQLRVPPDEGRGLGRQVVGTAVDRGQRREAVGEVGVDQLHQPLGTTQVLEAMYAQVAEPGPVRKLIGGQLDRGRRQQHLAAVADRHDPRRAVDDRAEVVVGPCRRLPGVQPHPHPERSGGAPRLGGQVALGDKAGVGGRGGGGEDGHHPVAGRLDHLAVRAGDGGPQDAVVALEGGLHGLRELLPEPGAALDVGEQEDQRSRRRLRLHRTPPLTITLLSESPSTCTR
jgi:hypothetical protein